ncbi:MAG: TonB-dependent receptor plug domain-containing protein [Flavobacteriales bacterium]
MKFYFLSFLLLSCFSVTMAQDKHTISGYITDKSTGEALIGAYILDLRTEKVATTNVYGFYSLTLQGDSVELFSSYIGYSPSTNSFLLNENITLDFKLNPSVELKEAVVEASQSEPIQNDTQMSSVRLDMKMVKNLPVLLGETDLLKTLQLLPGVQSGTEGASGIYVRGGGPDQNLVLLDGVPVYNASHLFGFFSVFNADAIRDVELIKGGFPARYGGRLSSVIDVRMKEGNLNEYHGDVSIGIISAKATVEGPIKKGKSSFIVSGRRTYIDLLARPVIRSVARQNGENGNAGYFFYDFNAKLNYIINDKNRVFLSGYFGNDKAFVKYDSSFRNGTEEFDTRLVWGNAIVAARWNHIFSPKLFSNTTLTYSRYRLFTSIGLNSTFDGIEQSTTFRYDSGIDDLTAKVDFDFIPNPNANVKFGTSYINHTFTPGVNTLDLDIDELQLDTVFGSDRILAHEVNLYAEVDWKISDKLKMNLGLHSSNFFVEGQQYLSLQPRVAMRYMLNKKSSIKAAYSNMTQFLHLLTTSSIGLPTDLWVPVTERIKPQISDQVALGYAMTPFKGYQLSVEGYYKWMKNLIEYKDGATFQGTAENWQNKVETGVGWSYGAEVLLEKTSGPVTGWVGYTLSWTDRQFENINFGEKFPYRFDRRHDFSLALTYKKNDRVDCGFVYVYGTGNAVTLPVARHQGLSSSPTVSDGGFFSFQELDHITQRNGYRMPSYHRLDIGINFHKEKDNGTRTWSLGIYNAYNRQNPFFLFFDQENEESVLKQASLFPILLSISYGFKF